MTALVILKRSLQTRIFSFFLSFLYHLSSYGAEVGIFTWYEGSHRAATMGVELKAGPPWTKPEGLVTRKQNLLLRRLHPLSNPIAWPPPGLHNQSGSGWLYWLVKKVFEWQGKITSPHHKQFQGTTNISHCTLFFFTILTGQTKKVEWQWGFPQQYKENAIIFNACQPETYFILTI